MNPRNYTGAAQARPRIFYTSAFTNDRRRRRRLALAYETAPKVIEPITKTIASDLLHTSPRESVSKSPLVSNLVVWKLVQESHIHWATDDIKLSDVEPLFVCQACGTKGADVRPDFHWKRPAREPALYDLSLYFGASSE
jgi:hypothetical protein